MESYDKQRMLSDKHDATLIADLAGVPIPCLIEILDDASYLIVIKTRIGNSAKGGFFPKSKEEALTILRQYDEKAVLMEEYWKSGGARILTLNVKVSVDGLNSNI